MKAKLLKKIRKRFLIYYDSSTYPNWVVYDRKDITESRLVNVYNAILVVLEKMYGYFSANNMMAKQNDRRRKRKLLNKYKPSKFI